ncbi:MAG: hypothetical protein ACFFDR_13855 [Candidatus Thorarchaeota archaeon]
MITYTNIKYSDFFSFFNVRETSKVKHGDNVTIKLKPGGFQEFIDIEFIIDSDEFLTESNLWLDRSWIGNEDRLNVFAKDIAKSYIRDMIVIDLQDQVATIVDILFQVKGETDHIITISGDDPPSIQDVYVPELRSLVRTFAGLEPSWIFETSEFIIQMDNTDNEGRERLRIRIQYKK